jgi:hypothetical protein
MTSAPSSAEQRSGVRRGQNRTQIQHAVGARAPRWELGGELPVCARAGQSMVSPSCCPRVGAGARMWPGASVSTSGTPGISTRPRCGSTTSAHSPLARTCGWSSHESRSPSGPAGQSPSVNRAIHSSRGRLREGGGQARARVVADHTLRVSAAPVARTNDADTPTHVLAPAIATERSRAASIDGRPLAPDRHQGARRAHQTSGSHSSAVHLRP